VTETAINLILTANSDNSRMRNATPPNRVSVSNGRANRKIGSTGDSHENRKNQLAAHADPFYAALQHDDVRALFGREAIAVRHQVLVYYAVLT
jgi:hypothetical protein